MNMADALTEERRAHLRTAEKQMTYRQFATFGTAFMLIGFFLGRYTHLGWYGLAGSLGIYAMAMIFEARRTGRWSCS